MLINLNDLFLWQPAVPLDDIVFSTGNDFHRNVSKTLIMTRNTPVAADCVFRISHASGSSPSHSRNDTNSLTNSRLPLILGGPVKEMRPVLTNLL